MINRIRLHIFVILFCFLVNGFSNQTFFDIMQKKSFYLKQIFSKWNDYKKICGGETCLNTKKKKRKKKKIRKSKR